MIRIAATRMFVTACVVLTGSCSGSAQPSKYFTSPVSRIGQEAWWAHGWGFAGPGVYREQDPAVRKRLASLFHLAHAQAAARACDEVEVSGSATRQLLAADGLGPLSPEERSFVARRRDALAGKLSALVGGEACEWAYENFGPKGAMQPGLIRSKDPETTSSLPSLKPRLVPLPPRRPRDL